jgi:serine/threonine-protein kinase
MSQLRCPKCDARFRGDIRVCPIDGQALVAPSDPFLGTVIAGRYLVEELLGVGGMGSVYRARHQFIGRDVALKFLDPSLTKNERLRKRFLGEARAANQINHEHIIDITDFGETEDGIVYMVMEYLEGHSLEEELEKGPIEPRRAVRIALQVALGLGRAHELGVVHRDIKPGNILVTQDGTPKLLDFGLAKLLNPDLARETATAARLAFTPAYASPEQVRGETVTTATDVYSLGVVLYELLTGRGPYRVKTQSSAEILRAVCEQEPERPSAAVTRRGATASGRELPSESEEAGQSTGESPQGLHRRLRGDLDAVLLMALRKEPHRRYPSVDAFADDMRRYLERRPVAARKGTFSYRTGKFVRRHWAGATAAALALTALIAGGVLSAYGVVRAKEAEREARREAAKARAINDFLQSTLFSAHPSLGGGRQMTVVDALAAATRRIDTAFPDQAEIRAAVQTTIGRTYLDLGFYAEAEPLLRQSLAIRREVLGPRHTDVAESLYNLGGLSHHQGDFDTAKSLYEEALALYRGLRGDDAIEVAGVLNDLGITLEEGKADYDGARPLLERALAIKRAHLGNRHRDVAQAINNLGMLHYRKGDLHEAERLLREALALNRDLLGPNHVEVASGLNNLALVLRDKGSYDSAAELFEQALTIDRRVYGEKAPQVGNSLNNLGANLMRAGRAAEAEKAFREALDIHRESLSPGHFQIATTESLLGGALTALKRFPEAEPLLTGSYARIRTQFGPDHPRTQAARTRVVQLYQAWGKPRKAAVYQPSEGRKH